MCDTYPFSTFLGDSAVMLFLNIYIWEYGVQWCPISALGTGRNVSPKCHRQDADHLGQMRSHILLSVWLGTEWSRDGFMLLPFPPKAIHSSESKRTVSFFGMSPAESQITVDQAGAWLCKACIQMTWGRWSVCLPLPVGQQPANCGLCSCLLGTVDYYVS